MKHGQQYGACEIEYMGDNLRCKLDYNVLPMSRCRNWDTISGIPTKRLQYTNGIAALTLLFVIMAIIELSY